jgi:tRNA(adenine34) deaminase
MKPWKVFMESIHITHHLARQHATDADVAMMRRAIAQAKMAWQLEEVPVGAVVYRGEEVIAEAHNLTEGASDPTAHAEVIALREASNALQDWRLNDCTLVVTLEPCPMCTGAIVNARVGRVVYGATDVKMGAVDSIYQMCDDQRMRHQPQVIRGVLAPECRGLLRDFFKERRKINKKRKEKLAG